MYLSQPTFITQQSQWDRVARELAGQGELSIDTEANSMYAYRGRIRLIQLASAEAIYLLDPLAVGDLSALGELLADPTLVKVMHGSDYDIRCFYREYGFEISGLFDTETCARFCGMVGPNLAAVLHTFLEVDIPKSRKLQRSNWAIRPLSGEAMAYAAADVQYLIPLAERFRTLLAESGRLEWVAEEFGRLEAAGRKMPEPSGPAFLRVKGSDRLDGQQLAVLKELFELREAEAERIDSPPYRVMGNDVLVYLAQQPMTPLAETPGLSPRLAQRLGSRIQAGIQKGLRGPGVQRPARPRRQPPSKAAQGRLQGLKQWRADMGAALGLDPALVWPAASLERVALEPASLAGELDGEQVGEVRDWQRREFGGELGGVVAEMS